MNNSKLINAKNVSLHATTLVDGCYFAMFGGATGLISAPQLPATTLANGCYGWMFRMCYSLETAPLLPATELQPSCYNRMFQECKALTIAPELPATSLALYCYEYMFCNCTSLNNITCLATNISASGCTSNWVDDVAASGTFIKADSMSSWTTGNNGIPTGWTVVNESDYVDVKKYQLASLETDPTVPSWAKLSTKPSYNFDEIADGTTNKAYTATEKTKLESIAAGVNWFAVGRSIGNNSYIGFHDGGDTGILIRSDSEGLRLETADAGNVTVTPGGTGKLLYNNNEVLTTSNLNSPALTGTPTAPTATAGTNSTQVATTAFVLDAIITAGIDTAKFQGTTSKADDYATALSGSEWKFSTLSSYTKGLYWVVSTSGTYAGQVCEPGDMIFCITDKGSSSYSASHFSAVQNNIIEMSNSDIDNAITEANNES